MRPAADFSEKYYRAASYLRGVFEFSVGSSAKWVFDVEIEKLKAEIFFTFREDQIMLGVCESQLIERLRPTFYYFIFEFPEWFFMISPKNIYISAKQLKKN
jgi:hypothetical protein